MNKILGWQASKVVELCHMVQDFDGKNLIEVFDKFAQKYQINKYSVRNFYYKMLKIANEKQDIRQFLQNNGVKIQSTQQFDKEETQKLLLAVLSSADSVRSVCRRLTGGDNSKSIRLQNKYHNLIKANAPIVDFVKKELAEQNRLVRDTQCDNIVPMPTQSQLKDEDIQALFRGLVHLVKQVTYQKVNMEFEIKNQALHQKMQSVLIDLRRKEQLISELAEQNEKLEIKLKKANSLLNKNNHKTITNYTNLKNLACSQKMEELKHFINNLLMTSSQKN